MLLENGYRCVETGRFKFCLVCVCGGGSGWICVCVREREIMVINCTYLINDENQYLDCSPVIQLAVEHFGRQTRDQDHHQLSPQEELQDREDTPWRGAE